MRDQNTNNDSSGQKPSRPEPEVSAIAQRRRFSAKFKNEVIDEVDRRKSEGLEIGSYLRKKGLTAAHISQWRKARKQGGLHALEAKKRGRKPEPAAEILTENQRLRVENEQLRQQLEQAAMIIDVQKKLSQLLGLEERK